MEGLRYKEEELLLWDFAQVSCVQSEKSGLTMSMACVVEVGHFHRRRQFRTETGATGSTEPLGCQGWRIVSMERSV
eukprot:SAG31_NODE_1786_length_7271_cov_6.872492_9_plen_76_part_00